MDPEVKQQQSTPRAARKVEPPPPPRAPKWKVECHPPTPLAHNTLVVEAANADLAREKFFLANGITATVHEVKIAEVK